MDRRRFTLASLGAVTACTRKRTAQALQVRLAVGGAAQLVYLPTTLAQQLGYYRDEGLEVTLQDFPGGSKALQALLGGSADVVSGFFDHTIQMAALPPGEARSLTAFVNMLQYPGLALVVSAKAKRPIRRLEDLASSTVGVTAPGSSTHFFLNYLLAKANIETAAVSVTGIGHGASALAALESGRVDAAIMTDPGLSELLDRDPKVTRLADTRTAAGVREVFGVAQYPASVLYAPADWIRRNVEVAHRLARAMKRTLGWIVGHTAEQIADKMPAAYQGPNPSLYREALFASMPIFNPNGALSLEGAETVRKVLGYSIPAVRENPVDIKLTFTNEFVEAD
jgi:NitT/TauT family transport system substrate-binding protein